MATEIRVISNTEKDKLESKIEMCLELLYLLEDKTQYRAREISDCINYLQDTKVISVSDIIKEVE